MRKRGFESDRYLQLWILVLKIEQGGTCVPIHQEGEEDVPTWLRVVDRQEKWDRVQSTKCRPLHQQWSQVAVLNQHSRIYCPYFLASCWQIPWKSPEVQETGNAFLLLSSAKNQIPRFISLFTHSPSFTLHNKTFTFYTNLTDGWTTRRNQGCVRYKYFPNCKREDSIWFLLFLWQDIEIIHE